MGLKNVFSTHADTSGSRGLSVAERILLRIVEVESDFLLSEHEAEEGKILEQEVESSGGGHSSFSGV